MKIIKAISPIVMPIVGVIAMLMLITVIPLTFMMMKLAYDDLWWCGGFWSRIGAIGMWIMLATLLVLAPMAIIALGAGIGFWQ